MTWRKHTRQAEAYPPALPQPPELCLYVQLLPFSQLGSLAVLPLRLWTELNVWFRELQEFFQGKLLVILLLRKFKSSVCFMCIVVKALTESHLFLQPLCSVTRSVKVMLFAGQRLPTRSSLENTDILPFTGENTGWECVLSCGLNKQRSIQTSLEKYCLTKCISDLSIKQCFPFYSSTESPGPVVHICRPLMGEAEVGGSVERSSQPEQHRGIFKFK